MKIEKFYFIILFLFLLVININNLNLPYHWDDFNYVIPAVDHIYKDSPTIFLWEYGQGHPPFFYILGGLIFKLFGDSLIVAHLISLMFAFITLLFTYYLGKELFSRKVGVISSLILLFTPIFISYSTLFYLEVPLMAFSVMAIYFALKNKNYLSIIFGSLAVLTKETGIIIAFAIFCVKLLKEKNFKSLIYLIPVFVFFLWLLTNKLYYGYFMYPISTSLIYLYPIKNLVNAIAELKNLFFDQFRWILPSIIILSLINKNSFKKNKYYLTFCFIISLISFISIFFLKSLNLNTYYPNINDYFDLLQEFSFLFAVLFFLLLINIKEFFNIYAKKELYWICIPLIFMIGAHFLIIPFAPRYVLPIYPLLFLLFGFSINKVFRKYSYIFVLIFIILSVTLFTGDRLLVGFALEDNLESRDFIKVRQLGASYLEDNFPNATILTSFPLSSDLSYPYGKYVKKSLNLVTMEPHPGIIYKNYTQYIDPETVPKKEINLSLIDVYYYSPQQFPNKKTEDIADKLNLTLIKKFEMNNKVTLI